MAASTARTTGSPRLEDPAEGVAVADPGRSSARQRREVVEAGGVKRTTADEGRPWARYALVVVVVLLVVGVAVVLAAGSL